METCRAWRPAGKVTGRGYYNEGAGFGVPEHLRDAKAETKERSWKAKSCCRVAERRSARLLILLKQVSADSETYQHQHIPQEMAALLKVVEGGKEGSAPPSTAIGTAVLDTILKTYLLSWAEDACACRACGLQAGDLTGRKFIQRLRNIFQCTQEEIVLRLGIAKVVGIITAGEWKNKPEHWKGMPRAGVMVSWDDSVLPIEVAEEMDLVQMEGSVADERRTQRMMKWKRTR
ncbi:unnamed protein product [Polarella glacialis]|uniref:Uncharacterized protein n=1 Tax=Polarella glacialis TaxID=89957 RepID=A0A813HCZ3_POLGL|nr:unnamed protein product [Polarella glacialis]